MKKVRLRYAPSPTGFLHIGNTRTALMNYLFAKHYEGDFIVRIEDTDFERNVDGAIESQFENMDWLGIFPDESFLKPIEKYGEYMQSKKLDKYLNIADLLIEKDLAYKCYCTKEELEESRQKQLDNNIQAPRYDRHCWINREKLKDCKKEYNIRFKVPDNKEYIVNDLIRGEIKFNSKEIGDFVIVKSNKIATYNFAVVIDDIDMQITHVLRGEEHISNTPKQLMIYEALNEKEPVFGHMTLIVDETKKKLSKRSGNELFFITEYRKKGYLPEALFNFISLLGWSPKEEKEIFSKEDLVKIFDDKRFSKSPSTFDIGKLKWINSQWMKKMDDQKYVNFVKKFIDVKKYDYLTKDSEWLNEILLLYKKELDYGIQINDHLDLFFGDNQLKQFDVLKNIDNWKEVVNEFKNMLVAIEDFTSENIKTTITEVGKKLSIKGMSLFMPIRIASTNYEHGPELAKVINLIGKEKTIKNIESLLGNN
ncbi:glutamyl-tRNA synthetase [Spiroplasma litorale]|uniref:Glutamate--tRNA ligase n=1 Tax=Spiroplasma litorale TaxID=216942 RepID=A0A0K1W3C5_9MOLU|nr:glutamate--tRNA ligase [Spiroplasma litorale]AKX34683.1 glutamyl-tRNA synthetase [Spiroplasma litorale]